MHRLGILVAAGNGDGEAAGSASARSRETNSIRRRIRADRKPVSGTRLIREWKGVENAVTVRDDGYEYQRAPYKSLSSIARAITGTRWNGWVFFGLKNQKTRP